MEFRIYHRVQRLSTSVRRVSNPIETDASLEPKTDALSMNLYNDGIVRWHVLATYLSLRIILIQ